MKVESSLANKWSLKRRGTRDYIKFVRWSLLDGRWDEERQASDNFGSQKDNSV